ncbi:branched-chain amino acid transport system II carrier protein [Peptoniphilus stercorisuis]|uniref:Branched-chain amino acid transport system carrier protein n=1 Tax=Peptoniphilus stercorisuis TaxID=1436965 RepID=A0ABS4KBR7_9FIRM|nr:branched-chain amino acid transport system II carrier protein [Peptoniphilus stercorisuis]MBP2024616.1 LIVCS family branched-chain amino acid:cation transporter [Peptoniphilus stercorisuis]
MEKLSKKEFIMVSLMLFSLFFGAGNLIFPPMAGKMSGTNMLLVMMFFSITAVVLPVLGVIAVAKSKGLENLASRVNKVFATVFTVLIYLSIGPLLGIPRAGSVPFEMAVAPYLPETFSNKIALLIYTLVFFGIAYWLSLNPNKLVERMGKILTPTLLTLILFLFVVSLFKEMPSFTAPIGEYSKNPAVSGFLDGYNTMDAVAALNFGFVIYLTISKFNISDDRKILSIATKSGILAGSILMIIYLMLAIIGARSTSLFPNTANGAEVLREVSKYLLGDFGAILVAVIFTLACLTTSVGLITSCSAYFTNLFKNRLSYRTWVRIWTFSSLVLANFGLNTILKYSLSLLVVIYPVSIILVLLSFLDKYLDGNKLVYTLTIYVTMAISLVDAFKALNIKVPLLYDLFMKLPFADLSLGWVIPAIVTFLVSIILSKILQRQRGFVESVE